MRTLKLAFVTAIVASALACPFSAKADPVEPTKDAPLAKGFKLTTVTTGIERPWSIAWLPDGSALVTEKAGRVRLVNKDFTLEPAPLTGVPEVLANGQGGLLDISLHPKFAENRWVYLTHSVGTGKENTTRLTRVKLSEDKKSFTDAQSLFELSPKRGGGLHFGSRLAWSPEGYLFMTSGDRFGPRDATNVAQNKKVTQAKILRLTDEGKPAPGNPFEKEEGAAKEIWSMGHRNIQGLTFDSAGRLWETEHGPLGGDELNLIQPGKNYGWPIVTFGREYSGQSITDVRTQEGMEDAKVVWTPVIAASGLAYYAGDKIAEWKGSLFAGGLASQLVRRIKIDEAGKVVSQETIPVGKRVRDVRQGPDGYLYLLTDERRGEIIRIEAAATGTDK